MALDAALVVRTGSAALWVALGLFILAIGRRRLDSTLLGVLAAAFGAQFVAVNLGLAGLGHDLALVAFAGACYLVAAACALGLAWRFASTGSKSLVAGLGLLLAVAVASVGTPSVAVLLEAAGLSPAAADLYAIIDRFILAEFAALATLIAALAMGGRTQRDDASRRAAIALSLSFGMYLAYNLAINFAALGGAARGVLLAAVVASALAWLPAGTRGRSCGWAIVGAGLAGAVAATWFGETAGNNIGVGLLRSVGAGILAFAIFRYDLLGIPLPRIARRRGLLTASALAALFITAQVAQNFLSAQYGLLMGGVIAGALVFAANPIQRALEERGSARTATTRSIQAEEVFRRALRVARHDGRITPDEERHLAEVADALGLTHAAAARVRGEIEAEIEGAVRE